MLGVPGSVRVFVCTQKTDMRRSFDALMRLAQELLGQDPFSGHLFVFFNRRADRVKILYWDRSGPAIWYKRLEEGTFRVGRTGSDSVEMAVVELAMLLEGIEACRRHRRYERPRLEV